MMWGPCDAPSRPFADHRVLCRAAAETESKPGASSNGAEPRLQRTGSGREARQAVAAKISAARALARKLSEKKQAAMSAARLAAEQAMNEEEIDRCVIGLCYALRSPAQREHVAVWLVGGRLGHTQRCLSADQQFLPAICRRCINVPYAINGRHLCRIRQSVEVASANAAKEVARADALARAAQRTKSFGPGMKELERLKVPILKACSSDAFWTTKSH